MDERGDADAARSATAMTLARLVNGVVDPKQKGRYAAPIATLAREVGLPRFLVDLRHECAHGTMPSAGALRRGARRALAWCRRWYWDEQARAFDAAFERVRGCVRAMCACEKDARGLRAREGRGAVESSSEEMDEDGGRYRGDAESGAPQAGESLTDTLFDEGFDAFVGRLQERPLREHIGHTPVQVVAGAVTGIVIGIAVSFSVVGPE